VVWYLLLTHRLAFSGVRSGNHGFKDMKDPLEIPMCPDNKVCLMRIKNLRGLYDRGRFYAGNIRKHTVFSKKMDMPRKGK
jgi:hypothetical protein